MKLEDLSPPQRSVYEAFIRLGLSESAAVDAAIGRNGVAESSTATNSFDRLASTFERSGLSRANAEAAAAGRSSTPSRARRSAAGAVPDLTGVAGEVIAERRSSGRSERELFVEAVAERFRRQGATDPERRAQTLVDASESGVPVSPEFDRHVRALRSATSSRGVAIVRESATTTLERFQTEPHWLVEAARPSGRVSLRLISPGQGSSGYYSAAVLAQAATEGIFPAGTQMYLDHPTLTERSDRPERSVRDLAAVLDTAARWEPSHPKGAGLYAEARVFPDYWQALQELAPFIGVSIRAAAEVSQGDVDGRRTRIVERIVQAESVDFVTKPGRGGQVLAVIEGANR